MATTSLVGQTVGKYRIVEALGRGGMAEVYKAYQESLDRYVAIKVMHSFLADEKDFLNRFQREAKAMASLSHSHIVGVYDFDVEDGTYYIVMEFISGETLKQKLETLASRGQRLPLSQAVRIVLEIADALSYAHSRSMVHRDIKPANIMINDEGRAVLTDFGIAKILSGPSYTATGAMVGTPAYMSPEQGLGQPGDERSDLYSLGVLFFQMATGRLPYDADTPLAVILKHVNEPVPSTVALNPDIPPDIQEVIGKAMAKDPTGRFQKAHDFARALREAVKSSRLELAAALPADLLEDKPTPPPLTTGALRAQQVGPHDATVMGPGASPPTVVSADKTRLAGTGIGRLGETEVAPPPVLPPQPRQRRPWLVVAALLVLLIVLGGVGGIAIAFLNNGDEPTATVAAVVEETDTPEPTDAPASTPTPEPTADLAATVEAAVAAGLASL
ncbi:MAG: serine/threonine protein kinase, partial [Chloroflexi bacterium]|nr:serine/threonine protein kinase [Chloroflexota bacterium]